MNDQARDDLIAVLSPVWDMWWDVRAFKPEATEAFADAVLANPDVVLRALGALPSSPNNGPEWENYWYVPKGGD